MCWEPAQNYATNSKLTSATFVRAGPVFTRSPSFSKKQYESLFSKLAAASRPSRRPRPTVRPSAIAPAADSKIRPLLRKIFGALLDGGGLAIAEKLFDSENVAAHMQTLTF
jgi:hypothetical protein